MKKTKRKRAINFNPDREFIADAVDNFLKSGGKIERLEPDKRQNPLRVGFDTSSHNGYEDTDSYLMGV
jgi:hypothetical protein